MESHVQSRVFPVQRLCCFVDVLYRNKVAKLMFTYLHDKHNRVGPFVRAWIHFSGHSFPKCQARGHIILAKILKGSHITCIIVEIYIYYSNRPT